MKLLEWFSALALREKVLVMVAGWVLLLGILGLSWLQPLLSENSALKRAITQQRSTLNLTQSQIAVLDARLSQDPNAKLRQDIEQLIAERKGLDATIAERTQSLVPPEAMASLLQALLSGTGDLQLVKLQSLPPEPLSLGEAKDKAKVADDKAPAEGQLYRHGLSLTLKGGYLPTLTFLKEVEKLPWHFYWQSLDFKQDHYPDAEIQIHVYTLGTSPHYLGA